MAGCKGANASFSACVLRGCSGLAWGHSDRDYGLIEARCSVKEWTPQVMAESAGAGKLEKDCFHIGPDVVAAG